VKVCKLVQLRLHTRTMVRDGQVAFVGSQSLRAIELDERREVGLIFRDPKAVAKLHQTFTGDWALAEEAAALAGEHAPATEVAKKVARLLAKDLPPVTPVLNGAVREIVGKAAAVELDSEEVEAVVMGAVKAAVKEVISGMVEEAVEEDGGGA